MPVSVNNNLISWERTNLAPGDRVNVIVESTDGSFLTATSANQSQSNQSQGNGIQSWTFLIIVLIIIAIGFLVFWAIRKSQQAREAELKSRIAEYENQMKEDKQKKEEIEEGFAEYVENKKIEPDAQGRYYDRSYGDYITPAIWAAVILTQQNNQSNDSGSGGGSTHHSSCACACVSCACACACACAGGGAAGCARKTLHECRKDLSNSDREEKCV
jgi:large-conductance mechanosensitive channel